MPQRISEYVVIDDEWLKEIIEHHGSTTELELALNLRDDREQLKTLKTYGEAKYAAETRLTELLKIAVEALELVSTSLFMAEGNFGDFLKLREELEKYVDTALDRIKGIG